MSSSRAWDGIPRRERRILLWRECQRHQDTDLSHTHCQSITVTAAKLITETVEFLRAGYYGAHCTYGTPQHE